MSEELLSYRYYWKKHSPSYYLDLSKRLPHPYVSPGLHAHARACTPCTRMRAVTARRHVRDRVAAQPVSAVHTTEPPARFTGNGVRVSRADRARSRPRAPDHTRSRRRHALTGGDERTSRAFHPERPSYAWQLLNRRVEHNIHNGYENNYTVGNYNQSTVPIFVCCVRMPGTGVTRDSPQNETRARTHVRFPHKVGARRVVRVYSLYCLGTVDHHNSVISIITSSCRYLRNHFCVYMTIGRTK